MAELPVPLRAALGLVASLADALKDGRDLPDKALELPVAAVSTALALSLRVQQQYAAMTVRGDEFLTQLRGGAPEEPPAWATFDDDPAESAEADEATESPAPAAPSGSPAAGPPDSAPPKPATGRKPTARTAATAKAGPTKTATGKATKQAAKAPAKKVAAKKASAKKAPAKTPATQKVTAKKTTATKVTAPRAGQPSAFDRVDGFDGAEPADGWPHLIGDSS